jgi:hypothetical protein
MKITSVLIRLIVINISIWIFNRLEETSYKIVDCSIVEIEVEQDGFCLTKSHCYKTWEIKTYLSHTLHKTDLEQITLETVYYLNEKSVTAFINDNKVGDQLKCYLNRKQTVMATAPNIFGSKYIYYSHMARTIDYIFYLVLEYYFDHN